PARGGAPRVRAVGREPRPRVRPHPPQPRSRAPSRCPSGWGASFAQQVLLGGGGFPGMWCVKLSDSQRDALRALVQEQDERGPALAAALEALDLGRWDDLPDATLP